MNLHPIYTIHKPYSPFLMVHDLTFFISDPAVSIEDNNNKVMRRKEVFARSNHSCKMMSVQCVRNYYYKGNYKP